MPFVVRAWYRAGGDALRNANIDAHVAYVDRHIAIVLAAGGITSDDGAATRGLMYVLDTKERAVAERFIADDPFSICGLIERHEIDCWRKSYFDRRRLLQDPSTTRS